MEIFTYDNNKDIREYAEKYNIPEELFKDIYFNCTHYSTRNSWGHKGNFRIGLETINTRIRYYNRTWESYTYKSLLFRMLHKYRKYLKKNKMI